MLVLLLPKVESKTRWQIVREARTPGPCCLYVDYAGPSQESVVGWVLLGLLSA